MAIYNVNGSALSVAYDISGNTLSTAYDYQDNTIYTSSTEIDYDNYSISTQIAITTGNAQAMELYNGTLFQFRGQSSGSINDMVSIYDFETGAAITSNMTIESGHANAVCFSNTFYDSDDDFPLLYCGDWFDSIVHVNRVTTSSATHLYDIVYDLTTSGYHPNPVFDWDNNIMYTVGYYQNSTTSSTDNYCILCSWDLADMTDNGDDTYTPTLLSSTNIDYIYVMQDLKFNDGYIWIESGYGSSTQYVYAMTTTGTIEHTIQMTAAVEIEGLKWLTDSSTGLYYAIVGQAGVTYYKVTFGTA